MKTPETSSEDVYLHRSCCGGTACLSCLVKKEISGVPFPAFYIR